MVGVSVAVEMTNGPFVVVRNVFGELIDVDLFR